MAMTSLSGTLLRYRADRGPVAFVLGFFALNLVLWASLTPIAALWLLLPLTVLRMFVAPINHHHQHLNTFRAAWLNRLYDLVLGLLTGIAPYSWVLHHNLGHHLHYLQQNPHATPDESAWTRRDGSRMRRVEYTLNLLLRHQVDIVRVGLKHPRQLRNWLAMKLPLYALIGLLLWLSPVNTLLVFLVPGFFALVHTIWATYEHHSGCSTESHFVGSVNRENRLYNWMTGNLGLHTAHHQRPGLHWSKLPQLHAEIRPQIPDELVLTRFW